MFTKKMQKTILRLKRIEIKEFKPKELRANIDIIFDKNDVEKIISKEIILRNPLDIVNKILLTMKSEGKMIVEEEDDDILKNIYITRIDREEEIEEKLFSWFRSLCEKAKHLKNVKVAPQYMKVFNEIKVMKLVF